MPAILKGDQERIQQVLINLVGNALKFTRNGYITVKVDFDHYLGIGKFRVEDTGLGIPETERNKLFTMFSRVGTGEQRKANNTKGVGLGLTICKRLVE